MKSIGAITGDIVGSVYEFNNHRSKDFPLFSDDSEFTDDSILTIATMMALMNGGKSDDFVDAYRRLGNKYPSSYGNRFSDWLAVDNPEPYDSWGNGSAMRVSPVAWWSNDIDEVATLAKVSAEVTHNHPEGVKGAQSVAEAIFLARTGKSKQDIKKHVEERHGSFLDFKLADIRKTYPFDESSAGTVPPAIVAFLESTDFEDAIRNAISIGGDSDTLAAITGSIAEAFYGGVPNDIMGDVLFKYLDEDLRKIVRDFNQAIAPILMVSKFQTLSKVGTETLHSLNQRIQTHNGKWSERHNGKKLESGANTMPYTEQSELIQEFVQFMYDYDLVINFDWAGWQEGREWFASDNESKYDDLDIETSLKLLTAIIRSDRFNEGALVRAFEDGAIPKITAELYVKTKE